jgi:type IV pilus assembly protein PilC
MEYAYTAYTKDNRLVQGKLQAATQEAASQALTFGGYQIINLKPVTPFLSLGRFSLRSTSVSAKDILLLSRQLALLLESGTDLVSSLELLQKQITNKNLQKILAEVIHDIRSGSSFSAALSKHPKTFTTMFCQAMSAGEQAGNLDIVLRQMSEYLEREVLTGKKVKNALTYPIIIFVLAIIVVAVMSIFVFPTFVTMFSAFGAKMPFATRLLMGIADWMSHYILYVVGVIAVIGIAGWAYHRTPAGKLWFDTLSLHLPILGRVNILNEISRCCRTMALLFKVGLPLPEILGQAIRGSGNKAFSNALTDVQEQLIRGEGLSKPMAKNPLFLPLMVQMISVGEETGNLDSALTTVAMSYETEADDRTSAMVGMIQPALTIGIALVIGFVAVAMISAMYGVYGQIKI